MSVAGRSHRNGQPDDGTQRVILTRYQENVLSLRQKMFMKRIQIAPHFSDESLKSVMNLQTDVRSFKGWQIIYFVQTNPDKSLLEISRLLGVSKSKVFITIKLYNEFGENWLTKSQWGGRREQRCHLSLEDEKQLMQSLKSEALLGKILTFRHIKLGQTHEIFTIL